MPEGSLTLSIQDLQEALSAVEALLGEEPAEGSSGSGYAGAAGLASVSLDARFEGLEASFRGQLGGLFDVETAEPIAGITQVFANLKSQASASPTDALGAFSSLIEQADVALGGDFLGRLQTALDAIRSISAAVPADRTAVISSLLDQIIAVVASLQGPEAEKIQSWIASVQEMHRLLVPLIAEAQSAADPSAIALQVMQRALRSTLEVFGFEQIESFLRFLDGFPGRILPAGTLNSLSTTLTATSTAYGLALGRANASFPDFRGAVEAAGDAVQDLKLELRPAIRVLNQIAAAPIFQPHALEAFLRQQIDLALAVRVQEVQKIDDPFNELFDRIDAAIDKIDLSFVRTEVVGFFDRTRLTLEEVNIPSMAALLREQLAPLEAAIRQLEQGVTGLLAQIEAFFDGLAQQLQALAGPVGEFQPSGVFKYHFEDDLRETLQRARVAIGGDPANPGAASLAGTIEDFRGSLDQFLGQISGLLQPIAANIQNVRAQAVTGINEFVSFLEGLNIADLMAQLAQKVKEIVDGLTAIDFDLVVDPVVAEIETNSAKLGEIDADSLNELLREALKVALDVIISVDFTVEISGPLSGVFDEVKKVPQLAIDELQQRYDQAIEQLDALDPEQLLQALFAAFDAINDAVGAVNIESLLAPLDDLHEQLLVAPLGRLRPSSLLAPVTAAFDDATSVFESISGAALIAPITQAQDALKGAVAGFDIDGWIDDLIAAVGRVKQDLREVRPSGLLDPIVADFARLEEGLDRFRPSVVFAPAVELATPLLQLLETLQQEAIEALFTAFQTPVRALDRLRPTALSTEIKAALDEVLAALAVVNLPGRFNQLKAQHFDMKAAVQVGGDSRRIEVVALIDPQVQMGEFIAAYNTVVTSIEGLRANVEVPALEPLYEEVRERLIALLPAYAQTLLDPETFKRFMRLADPTRFLQALDERFQALIDKLIPIRPQDLGAELDATYESVLALVEAIDVEGALNQIKDLFASLKQIVATIRVDFVAADIDAAVDRLRAMANALDPALFLAELDAVHHEVELVVAATKPSELLDGVKTLLDQVQDIVASVDPRAVLGPPLSEAWETVQGKLDEVDFTVVLIPVADRLAELEAQFSVSLKRVEDAFDKLLGSAKAAVSGGGVSAGAGVSL